MNASRACSLESIGDLPGGSTDEFVFRVVVSDLQKPRAQSRRVFGVAFDGCARSDDGVAAEHREFGAFQGGAFGGAAAIFFVPTQHFEQVEGGAVHDAVGARLGRAGVGR